MTTNQENWNPEFPGKENPSNPIPTTRDPEAEIDEEDKDNATKRTGTADYGNNVDPDNEDNPVNPDDPDNADWRSLENETANTDKTKNEDEYKHEDSLNRDRRNREEDANTSTGEDNRRGQNVE